MIDRRTLASILLLIAAVGTFISVKSADKEGSSASTRRVLLKGGRTVELNSEEGSTTTVRGGGNSPPREERLVAVVGVGGETAADKALKKKDTEKIPQQYLRPEAESSPSSITYGGRMSPGDYVRYLFKHAVHQTQAEVGIITPSRPRTTSKQPAALEEEKPVTFSSEEEGGQRRTKSRERTPPLSLPCPMISASREEPVKNVAESVTVRTWDCTKRNPGDALQTYANQAPASRLTQSSGNGEEGSERGFWKNFPVTSYECQEGVRTTETKSYNRSCFFQNLYFIDGKFYAVGMKPSEAAKIKGVHLSLGHIPKILKHKFRVGDSVESLSEKFSAPNSGSGGKSSGGKKPLLRRFYAIDNMIGHFSLHLSNNFCHSLFGDIFPFYWMLRDFDLIKPFDSTKEFRTGSVGNDDTTGDDDGNSSGRLSELRRRFESKFRYEEHERDWNQEEDTDAVQIHPGDITLVANDGALMLQKLPPANDNAAWRMFSKRKPLFLASLLEGNLAKPGTAVLFRKLLVGAGMKGWTHFLPEFRAPGNPEYWLGFRNYIVRRFLPLPPPQIEWLNKTALGRWLTVDMLPRLGGVESSASGCQRQSGNFSRKLNLLLCKKTDKRKVQNPMEIMRWFNGDQYGDKQTKDREEEAEEPNKPDEGKQKVKDGKDDQTEGEGASSSTTEEGARRASRQVDDDGKRLLSNWITANYVEVHKLTPIEQLLVLLASDIFLCNEGTLSTRFMLANPGSAYISILQYFAPDVRPDPRKRVAGSVDWLSPAIRYIRSEYYEDIVPDELVISPNASVRRYNHNRNMEYDVLIKKEKLMPMIQRAAKWISIHKAKGGGDGVKLVRPSTEGFAIDSSLSKAQRAEIRSNTDGYSVVGRICSEFLPNHKQLLEEIANRKCKLEDSWFCELTANVPPAERGLNYKMKRSSSRACWRSNMTRPPGPIRNKADELLPLDPRDLLPIPDETPEDRARLLGVV